MNWLKNAWNWLADSEHQKTLSFVGAGFVVVVGAGWQLYQSFSKPEPRAASRPPITSTQGSIGAGHDVTARASPGGTAIVAAGDVNVSNVRPEDVSEIIAHADKLKEKAWYYERTNDQANAEILLKESVEILKKGLGPDNPIVARHLVFLAELYQGNGLDHGRVEPLAKQALAIDDKALGPDHERVADDLEYLAKFYDDEGRIAKAGPLYQRALTIREMKKRPDELRDDVLKDRFDLGKIYHREGKYSEAESLLERSVEELSLALRENQQYVVPDLRITLGSLAKTYRDHGRYAESEQTYKRALVLLEKKYGYENSFGNIRMFEKKYGYENYYDKAPVFASILEDYAALLRKMDRIPEAVQLESRAQKIHLVTKER